MQGLREALWCGIDAGGRDDLTSIVVLARQGDYEDGKERYQVWAHQWLHRDGYNKRKEHVAYDEFSEAGELTIYDKPGQGKAELLEMVKRLEANGTLGAVGLDPYDLLQEVRYLREEGITVHEIEQGWRMTPYIYIVDHALHAGKVTHPGGPLLRYNVENGQLQERGRAVALTKPEDIGSSKYKIDGLACLVMSFAALQKEPDAGGVGFMLI